MGLSVSLYVCVCVCVSVTFVRTGRNLAKKMWKMTFVDFDICHRKTSIRKLYSVTLTYIFDFKCYKYVKFDCFRMLPESENYTSKHLRSNAISPVFLLRDLDLQFGSQLFKICEYRSFSYVAGLLKL